MMKKTVSVSLSYLKPFPPEDVDNFEQTFTEMPYTEERGFGFRAVARQDTYLGAVLINRRATFISQFDVEKRELVQEEIFLFDEIPFALDQSYQLLEVFGTANQAPKVRNALRSLIRSGTKISTIDLLPAQLIGDLIEVAEKVEIENLYVDNFQHQEGIRGRYDIHTLPSDVAPNNHSAISA